MRNTASTQQQGTRSLQIERNCKCVSEYFICILVDLFDMIQKMIVKKRMSIGQKLLQESLIGLLLWNILYDTLLRRKLSSNCLKVVYGDDFANTVNENSMFERMEIGKVYLERVKAWIEN